VCDLLTSGTTGQPQVFSKNARQLFGEALLLGRELSLSEDDTVLSTTASHHVYGLLFSVLAPFAAGANIVAHPDNEPDAFHPEKIAGLLRAHHVTRLITVPAHLKALLLAKVDLISLRTIVCSSAPLSPEDAKFATERYSVEVLDVLGSTETGGIALRRPATSPAWRPLPGVRVEVDADEQLSVFSPFLEDPTRSWRSGDRARLHPDGSFTHLGRSDGVVKIGGRRTSLQEIENLAGQIPGVTDVHALTREVSGLRGQEILLLVASQRSTGPEIKSALRRSLDPVFVPRRVRVLPRLPRTDRGKLPRAVVLPYFERQASLPEADCLDKPPMTPDRIEVSLHVPADSPRFSGHFPNNELLPALAQLTDLILPLVRKHFGEGALAELTRVKWNEPIRKDAELRLILEEKPQGVRFELHLISGDSRRTACSGTLALESRGRP
jgi:acyl-coenzyme A synthetase/AMP-(fatty) acid ligase